MKKYVYYMIASFFSLPGMAQTELEQKIAQLETQVKEQNKRNALLKEALDLQNRGKEIKNEDVLIRITSLSQDTESGELHIKGLIAYHGTKKRNLQFVQQQIADPEGNTYESYKVVKPNAESEKVFLQDVTADLPYGFLIKFENIKEKLSTLALLRVQIYGVSPGSKLNFDFKGLEVAW